jgi:hypothetical protein
MANVVGVPLGVSIRPRGLRKGLSVLRRLVSVLKINVNAEDEKEFVPS